MPHSSQTPPPSHPRRGLHGSDKPPDPAVPPSSGPSKSLRLGDFAKLQSSPIFLSSSTPKEKSTSGSQLFASPTKNGQQGDESQSPRGLLKLGNFSRLFNQLGGNDGNITPPSQATFSPPDGLVSIKDGTTMATATATATAEVKSISVATKVLHPTAARGKKKASQPENGYSDEGPGFVSGFGSDSDASFTTSYSTPASSPPSSTERDAHPLASTITTRSTTTLASANKLASAPRRTARAPAKPKKQQKQAVLHYQSIKYGPLTPIYDAMRTKDAKHEALMQKLISERVADKMLLAGEAVGVAARGIHVFVDMSNIIIGFQKALRAKYALVESARFSPLPPLNLPFFHELLTRGREAKVLNVGCSMRPNSAEPLYVQDLRRLGYRIDLRCRRPEQDLQGDAAAAFLSDDGVLRGFPSSSSSSSATAAGGPVRYVEDMVDETLQTRIGESVMQYFDAPGTLVIATGDARPAKFSDGFFTYAERALKMGWRVEVVSWRLSLSGAWTKRAWMEQWGGRFRVIELDKYLDEIFACYSP